MKIRSDSFNKGGLASVEHALLVCIAMVLAALNSPLVYKPAKLLNSFEEISINTFGLLRSAKEMNIL